MTLAIAPVEQDDSKRELALLKAVGLDRANAEQRELAINIANRYGLDLLLKHLVLIDGRPYVTRDGLLHIAHRSGQLDGMETTEPAIVDDFWRASCSVYRKDMSRPFTYTGRYPTKGGTNQRFAPEMATKVAEVMALRRAFDVAAPTAEERWDIEVPSAPPAPKATLAERVAERAASVAQDGLGRTTEPAEEPVPTPVVAASQPPSPSGESAPAPSQEWDYARFRKAFEGARNPPSLARVVATGAELFPGRNLELHEPRAWQLTSNEWQALTERLAQ